MLIKSLKKDLKKISKDNAFVDNLGKTYSVDTISDKKNTILIVYTHGSLGEKTLDKCNKK